MRKTYLVGLIASTALGAAFFGCKPRGDASATLNSNAANDDRSNRIALIGLNDMHGGLDPTTLKLRDKDLTLGGVEALKVYFEKTRKAFQGRVLVLDAGDGYQGSLVSNQFQGQSIIDAFKTLGVQVSTFGNHDFDFGVANSFAVAGNRFPSDSRNKSHKQGALLEIMHAGTSNAPEIMWVSTNVKPKPANGRIQLGPSIKSAVIQVGDLQIGVVGASTATTPKNSLFLNVSDLEFQELTKAIPGEVERLRRGRDGRPKADLVVLVTHAGGICDMTLPATDKRACAPLPGAPQDELSAFLEAQSKLPETKRVDVVMAGHMHKPQAHFIHGVPVVQTTGFGKSFSLIEVIVDKNAKARKDRFKFEIHPPTYACMKVYAGLVDPTSKQPTCNPDLEESFRTQVGPTLGKESDPEFLGESLDMAAEVEAMAAEFGRVNAYRQQVAALSQRPIATLAQDLPMDRTQESPTSNCIADAIKTGFKRATGKDVDLVLLNSGGVRQGLKRQVTFGGLFAVLPFGSKVGTVDLNPDELRGLLASLSREVKNIPVLSDGWHIAMLPAPPGLGATMLESVDFPEGLDKAESITVLSTDFNVDANGPHAEALAGAIKARRFQNFDDQDLLDLVEKGIKETETCTKEPALGRITRERAAGAALTDFAPNADAKPRQWANEEYFFYD